MGTTFSYRSDAAIEELELGECVMRHAVNPDGSRYWHMWFRALREDNGQPFDFCVPMNPGGNHYEAGPGGKTWGLLHTADGWQVTPSINVINTGEAHFGEHEAPSMWHQTPLITDVPVEVGTEWIHEAP